jgi:hypothetical protein
MLPHSLLEKMLGTEFFCAASRSGNGAVNRVARPLAPRGQQTPVAVGVDTGD